ncbi:MAG: hotdog fold thioesterase [Dehalococcoidia bacterium]|nr:hotdog fold thioesterase [Dehalococcoidia bacterium]
MKRIIARMLSGEQDPANCFKTLGGRVIDGREGYLKAEFEATAEHGNWNGVTLGGFLSAMLDAAMGPAVISLLSEDEIHNTVDMHVQFLRPAPMGKLICEARVLHRGRTLITAEATLATPDGKTVARATTTELVRSKRRAVQRRRREVTLGLDQC